MSIAPAPEFVAARPTLAHTNPETGERLQMVSISRPAGYNLAYISEGELNQKYKIVSQNTRPRLVDGRAEENPADRAEDDSPLERRAAADLEKPQKIAAGRAEHCPHDDGRRKTARRREYSRRDNRRDSPRIRALEKHARMRR